MESSHGRGPDKVEQKQASTQSKQLQFLAFDDPTKSIQNPKENIVQLNELGKRVTALQRKRRMVGLSGSEIEELKLLNSKIEKMKPVAAYVASYGNNIGVAESVGRRPNQEDRIAIGVVSGFDKLTPDARKHALSRTVQRLEAILEMKDMGRYDGSTLCSVIVVGKEAYVVNLGDSTVFSCLKDKNNNFHLQQLNEIHHPDTASELERIRKVGGEPIEDESGSFRIGGLAVSRSLGDRETEEYGLIHDPDITVHSIDVQENETGFLILSCDGLTENKAEFADDQIKLTVEKNASLPPFQLAQILTKGALDAPVGDNVSTIVMKIEPSATVAQQISIFDGHGGDQVAEMASELYQTILEQEVLLQLLKEKNPQLAEAFEKEIIGVDLKDKSITDIKQIYAGYKRGLELSLQNLHELGAGFEEHVNKLIQQYVPELNKTENKKARDALFGEMISPHQVTLAKQAGKILTDLNMGKNNATVESLRTFGEKISAYEAKMETVFRVAQIVLNVRKHYDHKMPISLNDSIAFSDSSKKEAEKTAIATIEQSLMTLFTNISNPRISLEESISKVKDTLVEAKQTYEKQRGFTAQVKAYAFKQFRVANLGTELDSAIAKVNNILQSLSPQDKVASKSQATYTRKL